MSKHARVSVTGEFIEDFFHYGPSLKLSGQIPATARFIDAQFNRDYHRLDLIFEDESFEEVSGDELPSLDVCFRGRTVLIKDGEVVAQIE